MSPAQETSAIFRLSVVEVTKLRADLPKISVLFGNLSVDLGASAWEKTFHPDRPTWPSKTVSETSLGKRGWPSPQRLPQDRERGENGGKRRHLRILLDHSLRPSCGPGVPRPRNLSIRIRHPSEDDPGPDMTRPGFTHVLSCNPCFTIDAGVIGQNVCMGGACLPVLAGEFRDT